MSTDRATSTVGVVVIGRNEGQRLVECLRSLQGLGVPVLYVDSGSSDGSPERAREYCDDVLALDPARPFSAARARNEGFDAIRRRWPGLEFVQFLDGDCTLLSGWLAAAETAMHEDARRAVVIGPLQERRPEASVYNRLCALEWRSAPGDLTNHGALGGIMLVRSVVFESLRGFNAHVIAGEDSEFGVRAAAAGWKVTKIATPMATHDADMHRFGQWWTRAVRGGHAIAQRADLNGATTRDCVRERRSVWLWGVTLPALVVATLVPSYGGSLLFGMAAYGALAWRVARFRRRMGDSPAEASLYARFIVLGKLAEGVGLLKFLVNRAAGRYRIIEYK